MSQIKRLHLSRNQDFFTTVTRNKTKTLLWLSRPSRSGNFELAVRILKTNVTSAVSRNLLKRKIKEFFVKNSNKLVQKQQLLLVTRRDCGILIPSQVIEDLEHNLFSESK